MKKIIIFLLLLISSFVFSQSFEKEWQKVYQFENNGKFSSAQKEVQKIHKKAAIKNNEKEIIKCFFYEFKFEMITNEDAQKEIVEHLKTEIKKRPPISQAILHYILATILKDYEFSNRYKIKEITKGISSNSQDFALWNFNDFEREIHNNFEAVFKHKEELYKESISNWETVFDIPSTIDGKEYNLYDFFHEKHLKYLKSHIYLEEFKTTDLQSQLIELSLKHPDTFATSNLDFISNSTLKKIFQCIKDYETFYLLKSKDKLDNSYYNRISSFKPINQKKDEFTKELLVLEKSTKNITLKQKIRLDRVKNLISMGSKKREAYYQKAALELLDSILNTRVHPNILAEADRTKNNIINKTLQIEIQKTLYPNQNNRAFVEFKNIDSVKVSYYKFPLSLNEDFDNYNYGYSFSPKNDSLVINYIENHKPITSFVRKLPNPNDYLQHTTEIRLENLDVGNYLIFFETQNDSVTKNKAFAYSQVTVTNFYIVEDEDIENNNIYVLDRKTGKPIENVLLVNEKQNSKTNTNGKGYFRKQVYKKDELHDNQILIIKDSDSIFYKYRRNFISAHDYDEAPFEARAQIFTDRAIYRPGQKMHFKGILLQNKNFKKSVVPHVTVEVYIEDSNGNELKTYELQTNEFGSFTGEFKIPKNVLTGEFSIYVDEPDNYENDNEYYDSKEDEHLFWDNVDFDSWQSSVEFQVEEYKRPTFEVTFDEIKENYTIGDTLKIKGNAKALAGNNLTYAKVKYNISKRISALDKYLPYEQNYIVAVTETDEKGNFSIVFPATQNPISNDSIISFDYAINVDVTDTNGETRSASQNVYVSKYMLDFEISTENTLYKENELAATITTTTQNKNPIPAKVAVEIYKIDLKYFKKRRSFEVPEIQTLSRAEFESLFPDEAYNEIDYKSNPVLIKTIDLNTAITTTLDLSFLKNYGNGRYKILAKAKDSNGNEIKKETFFTLDSKVKPNLYDKLFSYANITKPNSDFIEIEFSSDINDLWITTRSLNKQSKNFNIQTDQLINGKKVIRFKKEQNTLDHHFQFSAIWENQTHAETLSIDSQEAEKSLSIVIESFRNKIEPGSNENWSFKILDSKTEAEVLASMYDSSLDQFATKDWEKTFFRNNNFYPSFPNFYNFQAKETAFFKNFVNYNRKIIQEDLKPLDLKWFGFDFNTRKLNTIKYQKELEKLSKIPKGARIIIGVVSDDLGPVAGANVIVKGTTRSTTTDFDGNFTIIAKIGDTVDVNYVGMQSKFIVEKSNFYNVIIKTNQLEEVVVQGYRTVSKKQNLVQGQLAGVNITASTGQPGAKSSVIIRGLGTINSNSDPLYVIDGFPSNNDSFRSIKPDDIESITILKDSLTTSLYGSRGANGVIVILTKKTLKELNQVKTRTNFNETAFFYPTLKTDKDGKISFNFTTSESLTQWKLRLFAHNKNYETGYFESSIISQKEIMVQTNMPRFFRENDMVTISAKVVNMTNETKLGVAMLMLYNAENNEPIDSISLNNDNLKNFSCKPKESVPVNWKISIPKNISGLQYKIVAKSSNFSDGEENIIPVLSNKILVTESRPIWLKGNSKKEIVFENLLNNSSASLENQKYTLEYSSNPLWIVLQSLPYLMEYEHECAEQTFARYYANFIASEIVEDSDKINSVLESWKINDVSSKFNFNEDLKSIALNETPWLFDVESDEEKNMQLALLLDLNNLEKKQENTLNKLLEKQNTNGSFSWFKGGNENIFITQHILAGFGHLSKLFPHRKLEFKKTTNKTVVYLDNKFISDNSINKKYSNNYLNLHFWYARSFYLEDFPLNENLKIIFNKQFESFKKEWLTYSLYQKGLAAICLQRIGEKEWAKKIITHLKETASVNEEKGMYWLENNHGYYWYQSPIETQAIIIEAFDEIEKDKKYIEELKAWLLFKKQSNHWPTTKSTTEAIYALMMQGEDWLSEKENVKFIIGNSKISSKKITESEKQNETGYTKINWKKDEISNDMGKVSMNNKSEVPVFGGVYWQYFENIEDIKSDSTSVININKKLFKKIKTSEGNNLVEIKTNNIKTGDLITIKLTIRAKENLEFVHLKDSRASCFEPIDVISKYQYEDGAYFYKSTRDTATHFFFDELNKGTYILEYDVRVTNLGSFTDGIATIQSMYAPEFNSHSSASKVTIE